MKLPEWERMVTSLIAGVLISLWGTYYCDPADSYNPIRNPTGPWKEACLGRLILPPREFWDNEPSMPHSFSELASDAQWCATHPMGCVSKAALIPAVTVRHLIAVLVNPS
jgi:hypothetical protein